MNSTVVLASDAGSPAGNTVSIATILFIPILIFSIVGNVLVLHSVCFQPRFSRPANFMLANLSITSLAQISSILSWLLLKKYPLISYGPWTCYAFPILHACAVPAEGFTVMCISLERSTVVMSPLERESGKSAVRKVIAIWIASLIIELPHGVFWKYAEDAPSYLKCVNTKELFGWNTPYVVYACSYFVIVIVLPICFMLRESFLLAGRLKFLISVKAEWTQYQTCTYKLIRNALIFILIFTCLKLPTSLVYLITRMPPGIFPQNVSDWASAWKSFLFRFGALNGSIYPFIIFALSSKLREILSCCPDTQSPPAPSRSIYRTSRRRSPHSTQGFI